MGRRPSWPPLPRPHRASGQDRVRYMGKDYYLGPTGSAEARRNYAELLAKLGGPPQQPPPRREGLSVAEVVEWFLAESRARYDPAGREAEQFKYSVRPLLDVHAATPAAGFGVAELEDVRDRMAALGWSRKVINRRVVRIRTLFRRAEQRGRVPPGTWNALRALEPLRAGDARCREAPARRPAEWADLARVCRRVGSHAVRDLLLVLYYTGARPSELRTLKAGEVRRDGDVWRAEREAHKNRWRGQSRTVLFGPRAAAVLRRRLEGLAPGDYVFASGPGRCYSTETFSRAVARAAERAGVQFSAYQLRHAAKRRIARDLGLDAARAALGQASLDSADRYASGQDLRLAEDAARRHG